MKHKITNIIFLLLILSSCDLINPEEKLPTYIQIDGFELSNSDGVINNNISDVWFGTLTQDLGIYELPAIIPVLEDGNVVIAASAGVYLNGILSNRSKYFYYDTYQETLELVSGSSTPLKISPKISYIESAFFSIEGSEDFEGVGYNLIAADGKIEIEEENVLKEDNKIGVLYSGNGTEEIIEIKSSKNFLIDNDKVNAPVFLEFDYKTNLEIEIGLYITYNDVTETVPFVSLFSTNNEWTHAYIQLDDEVNISSKETFYKLFFRGISSSSGQSKIALDNVTVVYSN